VRPSISGEGGAVSERMSCEVGSQLLRSYVKSEILCVLTSS